ncbi:MAG: hypothetical protein ACKVZJ_11500 [Phycisphaerales bacterium]
MLRAFGPEGSDLVRRWVAALLLVPEHERRAVVEAVEARVSSFHASDRGPEEPTLYVRSEPRQGEGYVEHVERAYVPAPPLQTPSEPAAKRAKNADKPRRGKAS